MTPLLSATDFPLTPSLSGGGTRASYLEGLLLAAASGVLLALAMPKPGASALAWVALVPMLAALRRASTARAFAYGLAAGLAYFLIILYWVWLFGYLPWVLLAVVQALYWAVFAVVAARLLPERIGWWGYIAVPAAWTAMQWTRSLGAYGFPWGGMSHILAENLPISQLASVTGVWGIEFLVCLVNLALAGAIFAPRRSVSAAFAIALAAGVYVGGLVAVKTSPAPAKDLTVAIIQQNIPHDVFVEEGYVPNSFETCVRMSRDAARSKPDIIVWPESAIPQDLTGTAYELVILSLARETNADYLVGAYDPSMDPVRPGSYNAAHLFTRDGRKAGVYRKVHLVPFGEFVPLRESLPFLQRYRIRDEDIIPGNRHVLLESSIGRIGVLICFESLFPEIARQETRAGAVALFVTTNDSWFGRTQTARQHLMMSRLRAIENRRCVVRAALTGISAVIDPWGRIVSQKGIFERGIVRGSIGDSGGLSIYTRAGNYFAYACLLIVAVSLAAAVLHGRAGRARRVGQTA